MANYKKLIDVEVMEEVSENSMALVNENGVLKQVPCGAGFGGGNAAIIEFTSSGVNIAATGGSPIESFVCNNMTYSDIVSSLQNSVFVNVVAIGNVDTYQYQGVAYMVCYNPDYNVICLAFRSMPFSELFWYSDGTITTEVPSDGEA